MGGAARPNDNVPQDDTDLADERDSLVSFPIKTFIIMMPPEAWDTFEPHKVSIPRADRPNRTRTTWVLRDWAPVLINQICRQIPCPLVFKSAVANVNPTVHQKYVRFLEGMCTKMCTECGAKAEA